MFRMNSEQTLLAPKAPHRSVDCLLALQLWRLKLTQDSKGQEDLYLKLQFQIAKLNECLLVHYDVPVAA